MSYGYVYVLANDSLPYVKIGKTTRSPEERAKELTTTGIPTPFKVAYKIYVDDCDAIEKRAHQKLHKYRVRHNREFFEVDLTVAVSTIEELTDKSLGRDEESFQDFDPLKYVQNLVGDKEASIAESKLSKELGLERAHLHLNKVLSYLTPLNGRSDSSGLEVNFELIELNNEEDEFDEEAGFYYEDEFRTHGVLRLAIRVMMSVFELPKELWNLKFMHIGYFTSQNSDLNYYSGSNEIPLEGEFQLYGISIYSDMRYKYPRNVDNYSATDIDDPRKVAKNIISGIDWASEEDTKKRRGNNFPIEQVFERARKILIDECIEGLISEFDLDDERHWSGFRIAVRRLEEENTIAPITAKSWQALADYLGNECFGPDEENMWKYTSSLGWGEEFTEDEKELYPTLNKLTGKATETIIEGTGKATETIIEGIVEKVEDGSTFVNLENGKKGRILCAKYCSHIGKRGEFQVTCANGDGDIVQIKFAKWL